MHVPCQRSNALRLGMLTAGFLVAGMAMPNAFADGDLDREVEMLATMPDTAFNTFAPDYLKEGDGASVNASGGSAGAELGIPLEGVEVTFQPFPAPEIAFPIITGVSFDGPPVVQFEVLDQFGFGIEGASNSFRFSVSKLIPRANGLPPGWQGYVLTANDGVENAQATTTTSGTFEELGDGRYQFTFSQELEAFSGILFEPELTHRFGIELRGLTVNNQSIPSGSDNFFDIVPETGATEGIVSRLVVDQEESCASCHGSKGEFNFHGGPRQDVNQCVACHQQGSFDGATGNSIEFGVMLHKIHSASPTYAIDRGNRGVFTFEEVTYPQSVSNCVACHDPANEATPQAINIANAPSAEMCASCHENLAFDENGLTNANRQHLGLAQPNSTCAACHSENGLMVSALEEHRNLAADAAERIQFNILSISNTGEGETPVVTFSVTDPTDGDAPYDLTSDPEFTGSANSVTVVFSWPNSDYTNVANDEGTDILGRTGGRGASISVANSSGLQPYVTDNGDGTYTLDVANAPSPFVIPTVAGGLGSGTVSMEGHPAGDFSGEVGSFDDRVPTRSVTQAFAITDAQPVPRRMVVDTALCQDCHGVADALSFHGGNRNDNVQHCVTCHNPNATDIRRRPADPDGMVNAVNEAVIDGLESQTVDMKYMIHAIHGADIRTNVYYAAGLDASEITYPRTPANCQACHVDGSYDLPLADSVLATTVHTGATNLGGGNFLPSEDVARDPTDDNNFSATGAVCASCHDSAFALEHMAARGTSQISFGNAFLLNPDPVGDPDTQEKIDMAGGDNCSFCHGSSGFVNTHFED
ncbi:MAG: OmcA/MtrC family decaheme c-type cytochrome [Wenzhouxiangellaceae bacterium]|nr:OmcA/MtrC family decaheme c-type cytochrome [Wenzhouxiangellaceae bacterium]